MSETKEESNPSAEVSLYDIIGVDPNSKAIEIKKAFRLQQRQAHPDRSKSANTRSAAADLNKAYKILSNPVRRLEYDLFHGFKAKNSLNIKKLQDYKKQEAFKIQDNMVNTASQSREIESKVTTVTSDGRILTHAGLLVTKARYGLLTHGIGIGIGTHATSHMDTSSSDGAGIHSGTKSDSGASHTTAGLGFASARVSAANEKVNGVNASGIDSDIVSGVTSSGDMISSELGMDEFVIDVTDVLQCMVDHRNNKKGGFLEIQDNIDKSQLAGFYDPCLLMEFESKNFNQKFQKHLEIEYMFNRRYHYVKVENFEYLCIPSERHLVQLIDDIVVGDKKRPSKENHQIPDRFSGLISEETSESIEPSSFSSSAEFSKQDASLQIHQLLQQFHNTQSEMSASHSPISSHSSSNARANRSYSNIKTNYNRGEPQISFATSTPTETVQVIRYSESLPNIEDSPEIVVLPSGKKAISARPSLSSLPKYTEIRKALQEKQQYEQMNLATVSEGKESSVDLSDLSEVPPYTYRTHYKRRNYGSDSIFSTYFNERNKKYWILGSLVIVGFTAGSIGWWVVHKTQRNSQERNGNTQANRNEADSLWSAILDWFRQTLPILNFFHVNEYDTLRGPSHGVSIPLSLSRTDTIHEQSVTATLS